jgi:hypothetical protein
MLALVATQYPSEQQLSCASMQEWNCMNAPRLDSFSALLRFCSEFFAALEEIADLDSAALELFSIL